MCLGDRPADTGVCIWDEHEVADGGWAQLCIGATVRMCKCQVKDGKGKLLLLFAGAGCYTFRGEVVEVDV